MTDGATGTTMIPDGSATRLAATGRRDRPAELPLYPTIVAVAFVVSVWLHSSLDVVPLFRPVAVALMVGAVLTILGIAVTRDRHRGAAIAGIALLALIGGDDVRVLALAALGIGGVLLLAGREKRFRKGLPWQSFTRLLNLVATLLLAILVARVIGTIASLPPASAAQLNRPSAAVGELPDIVVILLDGHGREDLLATNYGEDISDFTAALESRGLEVSPRSRSNYMNTQLTLASMFNAAHVSDMTLPGQTDASYSAGLRVSLDRNRAFEVMRSLGYGIGAVSPGYEGVALRTADVLLDGGQVSELESVLIGNSAIEPALNAVAADALADQARDRVRWNLDAANWLPGASVASRIGRPYFMFVHVPAPHFPYLFDRSGAPNPDRPVVVMGGSATPSAPNPGATADIARAYAEQVAFIDGLAISTIDQVIAGVSSSAVIIVMADHGPDVHIDWDHLGTTDSRERFAILFAARTPGFSRLFGDAPTPVNLFPILLNTYAGSGLPQQSDSSFLGYPPRQALTDIGNPDQAVP